MASEPYVEPRKGIQFKNMNTRMLYRVMSLCTDVIRCENGLVQPGAVFDCSPGWLRHRNLTRFVVVEDYVEALELADDIDLVDLAKRLGRYVEPEGDDVEYTRAGLLALLLGHVNGYKADVPLRLIAPEPVAELEPDAFGDEDDDPFGLADMTVAELRRLAKQVGVKPAGSKLELIERIEEANQ